MQLSPGSMIKSGCHVGPSKRLPTPANAVSMKELTTKASQAFAVGAAVTLLAVGVADAVQTKKGNNFALPPISDNPNRCMKAYDGNTIGQANGVSNEEGIDLRKCDLSGLDFKGKNWSAALLVDTNLEGANLKEIVISKGYSIGANFKNSNLESAVLDRSNFNQSDFSGSNLSNAIVSGCTFQGAQLGGVNFEDAIIAKQDVQLLCDNPTVDEEGRVTLGCR